MRNIFITLSGQVGEGKSVIAGEIKNALEKIPGVSVVFDRSIPLQAARPQNFEPVTVHLKEYAQ